MEFSRSFWLTISLLTSTLVGVVAGWLSWVGGLNAAKAALEGAGAFAVALGLMILIIEFVQARRS